MIALALLIASAAAGLVAVYYWYHSARLPPQDFPPESNPQNDPEKQRLLRAMMEGITEGLAILSAQDNRKAAVWTAVAVVLGATSGIIGLLWHSK
jgi:hypothetical protein